MAKKSPSVGVIGLGIIGSRVAARLRSAGFDVWVWNRSPRQEPNFLGSAKEVAETADTIQIFVSDGAALIATVESMLPVLAARHLIVNHATVAPNDVKKAAELAREAGAGFLDAPFTGSKAAADAGEIVYYIAGAPELRDRATPILRASGKEILTISDIIGQASLVKIATNLLSAATVQVLAEALAIVDRGDVPLEKFASAIELNASNSVTAQRKLAAMVTGQFDPHFALKHMLKDVELGLAEARDSNVAAPATIAVAASLVDSVKSGDGDLDFAALGKKFGFAGKLPPEALSGNHPGDAPSAPGEGEKKSIFPLFGRRT